MSKLLRFFLLSVFCVLFLCISAIAQDRLLVLTDSIPFDKNLRHGMLENGLKYYLKSDPSSKGKLFLYFVVGVGGENEEKGQGEMAHLLEHMALNSTRNFSNVPFLLGNQGLNWGTDFNAVTGAKFTYYRFFIPDDKPDLFMTCLKIIKDWANGGVSFDSIVVNAEKGAVLQEIARGDQEFTKIRQKYMACVIGHNNHNGRIALDSRSDLLNLDGKLLETFYKKWYVPTREALIICGDFSIDTVEQKVKQLFFDLDVGLGKRAIEPYSRPLKLNGSSHVYFLDKREGNDVECSIFFKVEFEPVVTFGDLKNDLLRNLLAKLIEYRCRSVLEKNGVHEFNVNYASKASAFGRPFGSMTLSFRCGSELVDFAYTSVMAEIARVKQFGFLNEEVNVAKSKQREILEKRFSNERGEGSDAYIEDVLDFGAIQDRGVMKNGVLYFLDSLMVDDISAGLTELDFTRNRDVVFVIPERYSDTLINRRKVREWDRHAKAKSLIPYQYVKPEVSAPIRRIFPPIINESDSMVGFDLSLIRMDSIGHLGARMFKLANGVQVILRSDHSKGKRLYVRAAKRLDSFADEGTDSAIVKYAPYLVVNSGPGNYSSKEWQAYQLQEQVRIVGDVRSNGILISAEGDSNKLESLVQAIRLLIMSPKIDSIFFNEWRDQQRERIQKRLSLLNPLDIYIETLMDVTDFSREIFKRSDDINRVKLDKALLKYAEMYSNDGSYVFFINGSFNLDSVSLLMRKYIGTMPVVSEKKRSELKITNIGRRSSETHYFEGSGAATSRVDMFFHGRMPVGACSDVLMEMLKIEFSKLIVARLRLKEGISFLPWVDVSKFGLVNGEFLLNVSFDCSSDRIEEGIRFVREEFSYLRNMSTQNALIDSSRILVLLTIRERIRSSFFWSEYFVDSYLDRLPITELRDCVDFANSLTVDSMMDAALTLCMEPTIFVFRSKSETN